MDQLVLLAQVLQVLLVYKDYQDQTETPEQQGLLAMPDHLEQRGQLVQGQLVLRGQLVRQA
jgi:hypothetical protein